MRRTYMLSEDQLYRLLEDSLILSLLESGGVDNWEWYGESYRRGLEDIIKSRKENPDNYEDLNDFLDLYLREEMRKFRFLTNHALEGEDEE